MASVFKLLTVIVFSSTLWSLPAHAASFDCSKATTNMEKTICNDVTLSRYDERLNSAYKIALRNHPFPKYVKAYQRRWLKYLQRRDNAEELRDIFLQRIIHLEQTSKSVKVYSDVPASDFYYPSRGIVIEIFEHQNTKKLSIWGGWVIHNSLSSDEGYGVYTGVVFSGEIVSEESDVNLQDRSGTENIKVKYVSQRSRGEDGWEEGWIDIVLNDDTLEIQSNLHDLCHHICDGGFGGIFYTDYIRIKRH